VPPSADARAVVGGYGRGVSSPLRVQVPDVPYHAASRAVDGQPMFGIVDGDRVVFLALLAKTVQRYAWRLHAYCLMGNHFHLVLDTPEANIADGMRYLKSSYALWFNAQRPRKGVLFERRHFSELLDDEAHLFEVARYVVLNPVRARLCRHPSQWPWSSYRASAGLAAAPVYLHAGVVRDWFGGDRDVACARYVTFVEDGLLARNVKPL
jgi:REP element-mobilizing transposase RayT